MMKSKMFQSDDDFNRALEETTKIKKFSNDKFLKDY